MAVLTRSTVARSVPNVKMAFVQVGLDLVYALFEDIAKPAMATSMIWWSAYP